VNNFIFRLPQTIVRAYGIPSLNLFNYFQFPINRPNLSNKIQKTIYEINDDLLGSIGGKNTVHISEKFFPFDKTSLPTIVESNLVHLYHSKFKLLPEIYLVPYASSVFNPKFKDLYHARAFLKCLKNSWYFKKLVPVAGVYDWASMILNESPSSYFPWFWKSLPLDLNSYITRLNLAHNKLINKSDYINLISDKKIPLIIQPTLSKELDTYLKVLEYYYHINKNLQKIVDENDVTFFIKPHRSDIEHYKARSINSFRGHTVYFPQNYYDFFIPTEILASINHKVVLVSEASSSMFNSLIPNKILISNSSTKKSLIDYGLMSLRKTYTI
jgi:hypothetical protein